MSTVTQLGPGLWQVSLPFLGEHEIVGAYLLAGNGELALIDTGPGSTMEPLLASIREAGFEPRDVTHILATHVHLDHAGAVGSLLRHMPEAQVYAHVLGAPHLLDTTRVVASAARIYGERMKLLWGEIEPVPQERLHVLDDGDILNVAGRRLHVYYTPGHAIHHVIYLDAQSGELWAGDVAGVRLPGVDYVRPPTPPPDLDLEAWSTSIELINRLQPEVAYIGHFGARETSHSTWNACVKSSTPGAISCWQPCARAKTRRKSSACSSRTPSLSFRRWQATITPSNVMR